MPWAPKPRLRSRLSSKRGITPWRGSDNHGDLDDEVQATFRMAEQEAFAHVTCEAARTLEKAHGRLEIREYWTIGDPAILEHLDPEQRWEGLRGIGMVRAERRLKDEITQETRYASRSVSHL